MPTRQTRDFAGAQFETLLGLAVEWAVEQERFILAHGVPLSEAARRDAQALGVAHPEAVRVLKVRQVPLPSDPRIEGAAKAVGFLSSETAGLTVRYGIYVREDWMDDHMLLAHELVHTAQYERFGSIEAFLQEYLYASLTIGYKASALEQEAVELSTRLCWP